MQFYGPYSPTVATPGTWQINANDYYVLIENDSSNDLYIRFGPDTPSVFGGNGLPSAYQLRIRAWKDVTFPIPHLGVGIAPSIYDGRLYYLTQTPPGTLATSGTQSARNNIGLTTFGKGEQPYDTVSVTRQVDLSSQPRVVTIPTIAHISGNIQLTSTTGADTLKVIATIPGGGWAGSSVTVYLYYLSLSQTGARFADIEIDIISFTAGGAVVTALPFADFVGLSGVQVPLGSFGPLALSMPVGGTVNHISLTHSSAAIPNTISATWPITLEGYYSLDVDLLGQTPPPSIGNGGGTPPGVIY